MRLPVRSGPAKRYGAPSDSISVGLYFDDPSKVENPKWGIGWAVNADADSWGDVQEHARQVQQTFAAADKEGKNIETIRAVQDGPYRDQILKAVACRPYTDDRTDVTLGPCLSSI